MDLTQMIHDAIRMLLRRALPIGLILTTGVAASLFVALVAPPKYQSSARILVESQNIPDELARSTVTSTAFERLKLIEQRLMARDSIRALIEKLGLYADRPDMGLLDKIEALRAATTFQSDALGARNPFSAVAVSAFTISVTFGDPVQAAAIANELVSAVLQQNLRERSEQARQTLRFFDDERDRLSAEIGLLDREITGFKMDNESALPESLEFRRAELSRLLESRLDLDRRALLLEEQRGALQAGTATDDGGRGLSPEETLLRQMEAELAQKGGRLAPTHPEIQDLKGRIAALKGLAVSAGEAQAGQNAAPTARERASARQIALLGSQLDLIEEQRRSIDMRRAEIEASLQRTPTVETALAGLTRRRTELLEQYATIIRKRAEAETGEKLEAGQQAERFEVIENALPPEGRVSPSRRKIVVLGVGASLGLAFGVALLLELLNPALRTSAQMQRQLGMLPIAAIPRVRTRRDRLRRYVTVGAAALFVIAAAPAGLWVVDQHVRPIRSIVDGFVENAGVSEMLRIVRTRF